MNAKVWSPVFECQSQASRQARARALLHGNYWGLSVYHLLEHGLLDSKEDLGVIVRISSCCICVLWCLTSHVITQTVLYLRPCLACCCSKMARATIIACSIRLISFNCICRGAILYLSGGIRALCSLHCSDDKYRYKWNSCR